MSFSQAFFTVGSPGAGSPAAMHESMHESTGSGSREAPDTAMKDEEDTQNFTQGSQRSSPPRTIDRSEQSPLDNPDKVVKEMVESPEGNLPNRPLSTTTTTTMKKKKGTASIVKPPKRAKPGSKKPKPPTAKKKKPTGGAGKGDGDAGDQEEASDEASESDSGPYCVCRGPDNHRFMIACDKCEDWFHGECIGMDKYTGENLVQRYICPNCTDGKMYVTRYKKTCSLDGCENPARIYDPKEASIFCSDEHCQLWWEKLVSTLPKAKAGHHGDELTREDFMGLVDGSARRSRGQDGTWKLGDEPFGVPPDFWATTNEQDVLTEEQVTFLSRSATHRHGLGEEIVLCKKMLQLVDMALRRREAAIAASAPLGKGQALGKDFCGYDYRLDTVGTTAPFAAFAKSPAGDAVFRTGKLEAPIEPLTAAADAAGGEEEKESKVADAASAATAGMCVKKKCKPHLQWSGILTKAVKHQIKELAAQAKEKLDAEERVRDSAAVRYHRRLKENNWVTVIESDSDMEDA